MSTDNIDIGINIELTARSKETLKDLEDIATAIERLGKVSAQASANMTATGRSLIIDGKVFTDIATEVQKFNDAMKGAIRTREFKRFIEDSNLVIKAHSKEMQLLSVNYEKAAGVLDIFKTTPGMTGIKNASTAMKTLRTEAGLLSTQGIAILQKTFKELKLSPEMWQALDTQLGRSNQKLMETAKTASMSAVGLNKVKSAVDSISSNAADFLKLGDAIKDFAVDPTAKNLDLAAKALQSMRENGKLTAEATSDLNKVLGQRMPLESWQMLDNMLGNSNEKLLQTANAARGAAIEISGLSDKLQILARDPGSFAKMSDAFRNLSVSGGVDNLKLAADYIDSLKVNGQYTVDSIRALSSAFGKMSPAIGGIDEWTSFVKSFKGSTFDLLQFIDAQRQVSIEYLNMKRSAEDFASGNKGLYEQSDAVSILNRRLKELAMVRKSVVGILGVEGTLLMDTAQNMFWTGLGAMFAVMSFSRLSRATLGIQSAELSLVRATNNAADAQEKLQRYIDAGITSGKGYRDALLNAQEASLGEKLAQDRLKESIMQTNLSWMMLIFGTIPTLIKSVSSTVMEILILTVAKNKDAMSSILAAGATEVYGNAALSATVKIGALTVSVRALAFAMGLAFAGITVAIGLMANLAAEAQAKKQIDEMNKSLTDTRKILTKKASPSLLESFGVMKDDIKGLKQEAGSLNPLLSSLAAKKMGSAASIGPFGGTSIGGVTSTSGVTIIIQGPLIVRSEEDVKAIGDRILNGVRARGVRVQ